MFGMEPSVQLQEYSTKFFHTIKPHTQKKSLCYSDMRSWTEICKSKKNTEWSGNSIQQDQHSQLRTMSDQIISFKFGVFFFALLSLIKIHAISPSVPHLPSSH